MLKHLPVPHRRQIADGYCLPACVEIVLAYQGIAADQEQLAQRLGTVARGGTPGQRVQALASPQLNVIYAHGELNDLKFVLAI